MCRPRAILRSFQALLRSEENNGLLPGRDRLDDQSYCRCFKKALQRSYEGDIFLHPENFLEPVFCPQIFCVSVCWFDFSDRYFWCRSSAWVRSPHPVSSLRFFWCLGAVFGLWHISVSILTLPSLSKYVLKRAAARCLYGSDSGSSWSTSSWCGV